jgi:hypothetical protein
MVAFSFSLVVSERDRPEIEQQTDHHEAATENSETHKRKRMIEVESQRLKREAYRNQAA